MNMSLVIMTASDRTVSCYHYQSFYVVILDTRILSVTTAYVKCLKVVIASHILNEVRTITDNGHMTLISLGADCHDNLYATNATCQGGDMFMSVLWQVFPTFPRG